MAETFTVESAEVIKEGKGARGPWKLYKLTLANDPQEPTGFEYVKAGDQVTVETTTTTGNDGTTYQNLKYKKVAASTASAPAGTAPRQEANDTRVVKLLVLIATQVGVDNDKVLEVLQG